ncbi:MAG: hypothetical protein GF364_08240 [Candidatus Lokiarchaeota archaeon]|nr:hypothetical protein [Candidatus Lokiarchaeota archaeon]
MSEFEKILKRFVLEPIDDYLFGQQRIMERFNIAENVNEEIYKASDKLLYEGFRKLYDFEIINSDRVPIQARSIICCNHQSLLDPLIFGVGVSHESRRKLNIMAKIELFETPLVNAWIRTHFAFPIRRGKSDAIAYEKALELLNREELIGVFPEGTLNNGGTRFLEGKTGAVRLAHETLSTVVPMVIYGTDKVFGKGAKVPKLSGKIAVNFGKPMHYNDVFKGSEDNSKFYKKAIKRVMRKIRDLYFDTEEYLSEKGLNKQ